MSPRADVIILGAGVVGLSTARQLAAAGADPLMLDFTGAAKAVLADELSSCRRRADQSRSSMNVGGSSAPQGTIRWQRTRND